MNKKGFTLIELLAVILILGIIALIAIPTVNNIITESKVGAWKSTANNVATSLEQYAQLCQMKSESCYEEFNGSTGAAVKAAIGMKGELPDTFTTLTLNSNGDALVEFTTSDNVTCKNFTGTLSASTTPSDMTCTKN